MSQGRGRREPWDPFPPGVAKLLAELARRLPALSWGSVVTWEGKGKIFRKTEDGPGYLPLILVSIEGEHLGKSWASEPIFLYSECQRRLAFLLWERMAFFHWRVLKGGSDSPSTLSPVEWQGSAERPGKV